MHHNDEQHITPFEPTLTHTHTQWTYFVATNNDYYRDGTSLYYEKFHHDEYDGLNHNHTNVNKQNKTIIIPFTEKL